MKAAATFDPHRCDRARRILTFLRAGPARQGDVQRAARRRGEERRTSRYLSWRCIGVLADGGRLVRLTDAFDAAPADWPTLAVPAWILAA